MKLLLSVVFLVFICSSNYFAQTHSKAELDSLYNLFVQKSAAKIDKLNGISFANNTPDKCRTILNLEIFKNRNYFTPQQQSVIAKLSARPETDTSFVTQQNHFRLHFNKSGPCTPQFDVNECAKALDSSYNFEVNYLGYPPPPEDNGEGGDKLYDVYICSIGGYGGTYPENVISADANTITSFIEINYSSASWYKKGNDGMRVTAAHELHHAIQMGNYGSRSENYFFMELTSTSMEEFVYNSVNDYYQYLSSYFENPARCFSKFVSDGRYGYDVAIWNLYQKKKFGYDIIKREWELTRNYNAMEAIDRALQENNSTFVEAYNEFGLWCYYTNYRSIPGEYFDEAEKYPLITPFYQIEFDSPSKSIAFNACAASNNYLLCTNTPNLDTLMFIITNGDVKGAIENQDKVIYPWVYKICSYNFDGSKKLSSNYFSKLTTNNSVWCDARLLNGKIASGNDSTLAAGIDYPFPSPFSYKKNVNIIFPINNMDIGVVDIYIYNAAMLQVYSSSQIMSKFIDKKVVKWNARDDSGKKLGTGVYVYVLKTAKNTIKGKLVIVNE